MRTSSSRRSSSGGARASAARTTCATSIRLVVGTLVVVSVLGVFTERWVGVLVSTNQPSGRTVTVPNAMVLSSQVVNYSALVDHVWNEISVQVAYETDFAFATDTMADIADDLVGDEVTRQIARYREQLSETPVELRLWYLARPRRGQRVKNELYRRVLAAFNEHPDRVKFPIGRNR